MVSGRFTLLVLTLVFNSVVLYLLTQDKEVAKKTRIPDDPSENQVAPAVREPLFWFTGDS